MKYEIVSTHATVLQCPELNIHSPVYYLSESYRPVDPAVGPLYSQPLVYRNTMAATTK